MRRHHGEGNHSWVRPGQRTVVLRAVVMMCVCGLFPALVSAQSGQEVAAIGEADGGTIATINVRGNEQVSDATILQHVRSRAGAVFSEQRINEDLRRILIMPEIASARVATVEDGDAVTVVFEVAETPRVASIKLLGNKHLSRETLLAELSFTDGDFLDRYQVTDGANRLRQAYQDKGYYFAEVTLNEKELQANRAVIYLIVEGPQTRIKKVEFVGNDQLPAGKLKGQIRTSAYFPIFSKGHIDDDKLEQDRIALMNYYRDEGYLDARVFVEKHYNDDKTRARITFVIEEGPRYSVSAIRFDGAEELSEELLAETLAMEVGDTFTKEHRTQAERSIDDLYGERGYVYARVAVTPEFTETSGEVTAVVQVREGLAYQLGRVVIHGNYDTRDKVIRRQFDRYGFLPGGLYDTAAMDRAVRRLKGSGYYEDVTVQPTGDAPASRDAVVEVKEGRTGLMLFGVGVDTDSGVMGQFMIEQRNFDISDWPEDFGEFISGQAFKGAGQQLRLNIEPGTEVTRGRVTFHEPYLFDQPYFLDLSGYLFRRWRESYLERRLGGSVGFGRRFDNDWSAQVGLRIEQVRITDLDTAYAIPGDPTSLTIMAPQDVIDVEGDNFLTSASFGIGHDTTDRRFRPTEGHKLDVTWEQYGALGGGFDFSALSAGLSTFTTLHEDLLERRTVLSTHIRGAEIVSGDAPVFERYYAGGIGSIRGFDYRGVSPRGGPTRDPIGSDTLFLAGAEVNHPLYEEILFGKLFCDTGTVSDGPYRVSVGFGLDVMIPQLFQFIPMQFDFGFPVIEDDEDDEQVFSFSFGVTF